MGRPRNKLFYETVLPLKPPPEEEWLSQYYENCRKCINYLVAKGVGETVYYSTVNCLKFLRDYLIDNDLPYSFENAEKWLGDSHPKCGYRSAINRLQDFYDYGFVQPINEFPHALPNKSLLSGVWKEVFDGFLAIQKTTPRYLNDYGNIAARFLYGIQERRLKSPGEITYERLEEYISSDLLRHSSHASQARYTYVIGRVLAYMADKDMCSRGISWYPYYRMHNRVLHFSDLSESQQNRIESVRAESQEFPSEEFAASIPAFLEDFSSYQYGKTSKNRATFTLYNFLLFLEMNNCGYHTEIGSVWLEYQRDNYCRSIGWKEMRRILYLYSIYVSEGVVLPSSINRVKPRKYDLLPEWCHFRTDSFLRQKEKEGWKKSTITMYTSSVTRFCQYLSDQGINSFEKISAEMIKSFNLQDGHSTPEGKNAYNIRIRKFLQYLEREGVIPYGMHLALCCTSDSREKIVTVLSDEELEAIRSRNNEACSPVELRNRAILLTGIHMGLRASDIVRLKLSDIDWNNQTIHVIQEKTDHEILLPMPTCVGNALYLYIKQGRRKNNSQYVFLKVRSPYDGLTRSACIKALHDTLPNRHVPGSGFHVTRKTFASKRLKESVRRQTIADLMGHRGTKALTNYLKLDSARMRSCPLSLSETYLTMKEDYYNV